VSAVVRECVSADGSLGGIRLTGWCLASAGRSSPGPSPRKLRRRAEEFIAVLRVVRPPIVIPKEAPRSDLPLPQSLGAD
jgi:hypothetical protein